ncbi:hypothetical protein [Hymenobacter psychrophilus]|uniref:Uncharacterized protein n=1 Tax=Hymenobacter psychrophilus TaxID=651662 RepID=A0A1H3MY35_9BACT|nr:hypothetical protein [Hymenobacter psychrophilus]SDY81582.1 hypothetical protein SAMN04488069_11457 [Hymenobacter psychrophilus]
MSKPPINPDNKQPVIPRQPTRSAKGIPAGEGLSKASVKTIPDLDELSDTLDLGKEYTDGPDEPGANAPLRHPNRNLDKPDNDHQPYA